MALTQRIKLPAVADLLSLPDALLAELIAGDALEARAETFAAVGRLRAARMQVSEGQTGHNTTSTDLVDYFRAERARVVEPWRNAAEKVENIVKGIRRQTIDEQRELFLDMAKNAMLTEQEVLFGQYLFYGEPADVHLLRGMLLAARGGDRIRLHNFVVASEREESFLRMHGEVLQYLQYPLFPASRSFAALNEKLLAEVHGPSGGGTRKQKPSVFSVDPSGGETLPVVTTKDGGWGVDTSQIEEAFGQVFERLNTLGSELKSVKDADLSKATDHLRQLKNIVSSTRQQVRTASGTARGFGGRGAGGRGQYRGSGGRGYGRPRGGGDEQADF